MTDQEAVDHLAREAYVLEERERQRYMARAIQDLEASKPRNLQEQLDDIVETIEKLSKKTEKQASDRARVAALVQAYVLSGQSGCCVCGMPPEFIEQHGSWYVCTLHRHSTTAVLVPHANARAIQLLVNIYMTGVLP